MDPNARSLPVSPTKGNIGETYQKLGTDLRALDATRTFLAGINWQELAEQRAWMAEANNNFFELEMADNFIISGNILQLLTNVATLAAEHFGCETSPKEIQLPAQS